MTEYGVECECAVPWCGVLCGMVYGLTVGLSCTVSFHGIKQVYEIMVISFGVSSCRLPQRMILLSPPPRNAFEEGVPNERDTALTMMREVRMALNTVKGIKATVPDDIPVKV